MGGGADFERVRVADPGEGGEEGRGEEEVDKGEPIFGTRPNPESTFGGEDIVRR